MTWGVHMRSPWQLWKDLGTRRFIGFQIQFLFMLTQYLLAPAIWGFWLLSLGMAYPLSGPLEAMFGTVAIPLFFALLIGSEILNIAVGLFAVRNPKHRHLRPWVLTMQIYFPLAWIAIWKAVHEMIRRPFYWDKTAHGIFAETSAETITAPAPGTVAIPVLGKIGDETTAPAPSLIKHEQRGRSTTNHKPSLSRAG